MQTHRVAASMKSASKWLIIRYLQLQVGEGKIFPAPAAQGGKSRPASECRAVRSVAVVCQDDACYCVGEYKISINAYVLG